MECTKWTESDTRILDKALLTAHEALQAGRVCKTEARKCDGGLLCFVQFGDTSVGIRFNFEDAKEMHFTMGGQDTVALINIKPTFIY